MSIVPLSTIPDTLVTTTDGLGMFKEMFGCFAEMPSCDLLEGAQMTKWFRDNKDCTLDVPYPENDDGQQLPHGALLDFNKVPIR